MKAQKTIAPSQLVELHRLRLPGAAPRPSGPAEPRLQIVPKRPREEVLRGTLLEANAMKRPMRAADYAVSLTVHLIILAVLLLIPLYFTAGLNLSQWTTTFLVAPPPPPPPPPPAVAVARPVVRPTFIKQGRLTAPVAIPKKIAMIKEAPLPEAPNEGVTGGVAGGVPGGQLGGVLGGIIGATERAAPPPPPTAAPRIVRVGGDLRMPKMVYGPAPLYPAIARNSGIQGDVYIEAIIGTDGRIMRAHYVSGPPLLAEAALQAVRRWRYVPTLLDGKPVAVEARITVSFQLSQ